MINWAEMIFVMEVSHKKRILDKFEFNKNEKRIEILDIPDDYKYMEDELVKILRIKLDDLFDK